MQLASSRNMVVRSSKGRSCNSSDLESEVQAVRTVFMISCHVILGKLMNPSERQSPSRLV